MARLQQYFEQFHEVIRVDFDMSEELREKRDIVLERVRKHLSENELPGFRELHQGSYRMKTGVKPVGKLEYDIDVGLRFALRPEEYTSPTVRGWVLDAVEGHTKRVEDKKPCIRVNYEERYHLDLVVYACWEDVPGVETFRLGHKTSGWRDADPAGLVQHVDRAREAFADTEDGKTKTDQFRRIVRYLKRWGDEANPHDSDSKPSGLAFALLCVDSLAPRCDIDGTPDDRRALEELAASLSMASGRIVARKPTPEYEDVLGRLPDTEMEALKKRFGKLADALIAADAEADPVKACTDLQKVLGTDFPVPAPKATARKTKAPAIVSSGSSA